jgi:glutamate racemase
METENSRAVNADLPIGVFDSGVGGLTVVKEIINQMPNERIVYFGDTARVPYGSKSRDTVVRYSRQIVRFLLEQNVKAIAVACNTASAYAIPEIEAECPVPVIGVIRPGAKTAVEGTRNGRIGVIGTRATITSGSYKEYIREIMPGAEVFGQACPLFVPLVEEGLWEDPVTDEIARRYMASLIDRDIDTLIMGCTHYPLIRKTIGRAAGDKVLLVNPAYETARELRKLLESRSLISGHRYELGSTVPQYRFYVSDMADQFQKFANSIIKYGILAAEKIDIYNYSARPLSEGD